MERITAEERRIRRLTPMLSFFIPFTLLLLVFALRDIAPFGGRTLCSMDGFSQYYPMLENMKSALGQGEPFYSFSGGLGVNLVAQSAYYTNSPLWLIYYLLPESFKFSGLHLIIALRISLAGFFFCLRLVKNHKERLQSKNILWFIALSCSWALSAYMTAFINQLMWTDVVMLLPLVIMGIESLVKDKKPLLYTIALFFSIWSCFYLSYMVCIFSVLWFFFLLFKEKINNKRRLQLCVLFGFSSLAAGALAGVVLLPTIKALSLTAASEAGFEGSLALKYSLPAFLVKLLPFNKVSLEYGPPNLYCGTYSVIAAVMLFFCKKLSKRERLLSFVFLSFMCITMSVNLGEFVWHGFHYPNQLPARQSFLVIFLILSLAAEGIDKVRLKSSLSKVMAYFLIAEVCLSAMFQLTTQTWASKIDSLTRYDEVMEEFKELSEDEIFVRQEWDGEKKNNSPQQYSYNGIIYYSSTMSEDCYSFFRSLGMEKYAGNVSTYYNSSDIADTLLGVKYIISDKGEKIRENPYALPLAYLSEREILSLDLSEYTPGEEAQQALWQAVVPDNSEDLPSSAEYLKKNSMTVTYFDTDVIRGAITVEKDGVLLSTLPYDEGWEFFIDGEKTVTSKAAGYLTAAEIEKGSHEIEMRYTVPGIKAGAAISLLGLIILLCLIIYRKKQKKHI